MNDKEIAISIVERVYPYFVTSKDKWEDTCYTEMLSRKDYHGYLIVVKGERRYGKAFFAIFIWDTKSGSDIIETYSEDANVLSLRDAIVDALKQFGEYMYPKSKKRKAKYRKGSHILSMDELVKQEFVFLNDKITHRGWFMSWQMRMVCSMLGENGHIYYAIKNVADKIICTNCEKKFADGDELKKFVEVRKAADDVYVIDYEPGMDLDKNCQVFKGCPNCRTDAFLMDLEEE